jgi:putative two-component system response regulator
MSDLNEKKILIVDDQPDNLKILQRQLKIYNSDVASNGEDALRLAEENKPDLILLDVMMPEMDGFSVAKKLKSNPETASIPIIFVTAKTDVGSFIEGFDLGADEYIMKPYDPNVVRQVVKNKLYPVSEDETEID